MGSLLALVQGAGGAGLINTALGDQPTDVDAGNAILGQIFGSKDVSRAVADHASGQSGLDASTLKKLLPVVAMMVAGYMAKSSGGTSAAQSGSGGDIADILGSVLGGGQGGNSGLGGGLGGILGSVLGGNKAGGLGSLLDRNGDGNPLDDILGMAKNFSGK